MKVREMIFNGNEPQDDSNIRIIRKYLREIYFLSKQLNKKYGCRTNGEFQQSNTGKKEQKNILKWILKISKL